MKVDVLYFAWVRERVGFGSETIETDATTIGGLIDDLVARGENYQAAFADRQALRAAVNQQLVEETASLSSAIEVAFFPPMTGG